MSESPASGAFPNTQPWLARPEWARRRIADGSRGGMWFFLLFAAFWNAIAWTAAVLALRTQDRVPDLSRLMVLLFPLIGLLLAVAAGHAVLRFLRYGVSVLELATLPAPPGRLLAGVVETRGIIAPAAGFRVRLSCLRVRVSGSGKNRTTREELLWQDERMIPGASQRREGIGIPFAIPVPADARESDDRDPRDRTVWRVNVDADVPGVDYRVSFEVPVFRTAESATPLSAQELAALDPLAASAAQALPADSPIGVSRTLHGVELNFPAGRPAAGAWGLLLFALLWTGGIYLMLRLEAPVFFLIVFGLIDVVILLALMPLFLLRSTVRAEGATLTLSRSLAGIPLADVQLDRSAIAKLEPEFGFRSGSNTTWDLALWRPDNRKVILGRSIRSRREADWLAARLRTQLELAE